ncbi:MAG: efflux RND transporter periplasmic adaptor subunit [Acidobacteria bacterium]|nr:efflux RND transporter periplasmic adaptor subunit [Acidobacteriota bacterium]
MRRFLFMGGIAVLLLASGCSRNELGEMKQLPPVRTRIQTVQAESLPVPVSGPGQITSRKDAYISAKSMGTVIAIRVKAGETVKKGQSLLEIDSSDINSKLQQAKGALAQAEAALTIAENNYHRFQELYKRKAASKVELEQMKYQYDSARGAVEMASGAVKEAKAYLKYASVRAPFDAVIIERMINVGDFAAPGRPLFRIIDPADMQFECRVSESDARYVKQGEKVPVKLDNFDGNLTGTIAEIGGGSDFMTHTVAVYIHLSTTKGLRAGMYGQAFFPGIRKKRILIPESWIARRGELSVVFLKGKNGRAEMRIIRTGKKYGDKVEVTSGLNGGEHVATTSISKLSDGIKLEEI